MFQEQGPYQGINMHASAENIKHDDDHPPGYISSTDIASIASRGECVTYTHWCEKIPGLERILEEFGGDIETTETGALVLNPPTGFPHEWKSGIISNTLMRLSVESGVQGMSMGTVTLNTPRGQKITDAAWFSQETLDSMTEAQKQSMGEHPCADICIEVLSPSNTHRELRDKSMAYFEAGAREVWICDEEGHMEFLLMGEWNAPQSQIFPQFPTRIPKP